MAWAPVRCDRATQSVDQALPEPLEGAVDGPVVGDELVERGARGRQRHQCGVVRAGVADGPVGEQRHDLATAGEGADARAVGHGLGERAQVGVDAPRPLRPTGPEAEAGDDLVHDQQDVVLAGDLVAAPSR